MDLSTIRLDATASTTGLWFSFDAWLERGDIVCAKDPGAGAWVRIARYDNPKFASAMARLYGPFASVDPTKEQASQIQRDAMAETIVLGLSGFEDAGAPVAYSLDVAKGLLNDQELPQFFAFVYTVSRRETLFRRRAVEAIRGN